MYAVEPFLGSTQTSYHFYNLLANCPSRMTGESKVVLKNIFLLKSLTMQHIKIKITAYLCLMKDYNTI
jgi:hypothetical protein